MFAEIYIYLYIYIGGGTKKKETITLAANKQIDAEAFTTGN